MKRRVLAAGVAAFLFAAPVAGAGGKAETKVHFTVLIETGSDGSYFEGSIESSKKRCANDRKVSVYRKRGGPDLKIGSTRSERRGDLGYEWIVESDDPLVPGKYYAKAGTTNSCQGDKSPTLAYQEL
jgi:hypothetical protein